jgi:hypothetical protein
MIHVSLNWDNRLPDWAVKARRCGESNNLSEMGAEFGLVCCCFLLPFAPTPDKGLIQNSGCSRR